MPIVVILQQDQAPEAPASAETVCRDLYNVLVGTGHAPFCRATLSVGYDETQGEWHQPNCTCGRDAALIRYEIWARAEKTTLG
jgi:hypothetical protein